MTHIACLTKRKLKWKERQICKWNFSVKEKEKRVKRGQCQMSICKEKENIQLGKEKKTNEMDSFANSTV